MTTKNDQNSDTETSQLFILPWYDIYCPDSPLDYLVAKSTHIVYIWIKKPLWDHLNALLHIKKLIHLEKAFVY